MRIFAILCLFAAAAVADNEADRAWDAKDKWRDRYIQRKSKGALL